MPKPTQPNNKLFDKISLLIALIAIFALIAYTLINPRQSTNNRISGIAIDNQNNIFVFNTASEQIQKYNTKGDLLLSWGQTGTGLGQFSTMDSLRNGLGLDSQDDVYVTDSENFRIEKFDASGKFLFAFGTEGTGPGQFILPNHVAVDKQGNIYVSDNTGRLQKFDAQGNFLQQFDIKDNNNQNEGTSGIAIDQQGNILAVCAYNVLKFTPDGKFLTKWPHVGFTNNIAIDSQGYIYTDDENEIIRKFDATGQLLKTWKTSDSFSVIIEGLAVDSHNVIYEVANSGSDASIEKYDSSGDYLGNFSIGLPSWFEFIFMLGISLLIITSSFWNFYRSRKELGVNKRVILKWSDNRMARNTQLIAVTAATLGAGISFLNVLIQVLVLQVFSRFSTLLATPEYRNLTNIAVLAVQLVLFITAFVFVNRIATKPLQAGIVLVTVGAAIILTFNLTLILFALMLIFAGVLSLVVWNKTKPSFN